VADYNFNDSGAWSSERRDRLVPIVGAIVGVIAIVAGLYWWFAREEAPVTEPAATAERAAQEVAPPQEVAPRDIALPPLDQSDTVVRLLVGALSSHPGLASWLMTDHLVRRFVVTVENVADGSNPAQHVPFIRSPRRFVTSSVAGELRIDPRSYGRYDGAAAIVDSIDVQGAARLYRQLQPVITEAYAELGHPEGGFDETLERALHRLLETPVVERQPVPIQPRSIFFEFTDQELERLAPVQKQFMGMGPQNMRIVQAKLRDLAAALGLSTARLPPTAVVR
jgi:hypothetical protein